MGCAIVFASADLSTNIIKNTVKRYRPSHNLEIKDKVYIVQNYSGGKYGFFSAHAANNFAIITYIFFCVHWLRKNFSLFIFIYPLVVAYSRIYLGVHYPSDIIMGITSGLFFGYIGYYIMNKYFLKLDDKVT